MPQALESSKPNSPDIRDDISAADDSESEFANLEREIYTPYKYNKSASNEKAEDKIRVSCPQLKTNVAKKQQMTSVVAAMVPFMVPSMVNPVMVSMVTSMVTIPVR
ncbi:unnamed protein product [Phytophthora fragariaefolia]|uniref:Unnamed protein product n=1 Tax=Phytophthora fragariaefolia TaxID=1490495 RepID=A0A9W6YF16_9STRA|nr:unnamed protein product [Phytophthora fragariaefolia]